MGRVREFLWNAGIFTHRSIPVNRGCLYFLDSKRPPPQAACNAKVLISEPKITSRKCVFHLSQLHFILQYSCYQGIFTRHSYIQFWEFFFISIFSISVYRNWWKYCFEQLERKCVALLLVYDSVAFWETFSFAQDKVFDVEKKFSKLNVLTSMWSQRLYLSQISAISGIGSKAPMTVVPAVALTKNGIWPIALRSKTSSSSFSGIIRPRSSLGTITQLSVPKPHTEAHDFTE